jgi:putative effector of murein hydrolase LrgA (UPF0299 family)
MLLNAAHVLWFQIILCMLYGVMTIGSIILVLPSMGLPGAVWSMTLLYLVVLLFPYYFKAIAVAKVGIAATRLAEQ